jgi:hypothetical protein
MLFLFLPLTLMKGGGRTYSKRSACRLSLSQHGYLKMGDK